MSYCINPQCPQPQNTRQPLFCQSCGSELLLEGCYRVIRPLGGGGFANTYEVDDSGTAKVLKVLFNIHPKAVELFQKEAAVLSILQHPGIPKVDSDGYFTYLPRNSPESLHCLVMEKIEGMDLAEYLTQRHYEPISERAAVRWLKQLAEILHQVHQQQYFHRDIKPPNIMLRPNGQLVLIDFGTAREVTQTFINKVAGQQVTGIISAGYTPREQMNGKAVPQSDFFALGRTFVYLLTGKSPDSFAEDSRNGELIWRDHAAGISDKLVEFIDYLMAPFPGNRPQDTQEILHKLAKFDTASPAFGQNTGNNQSANYYNQISQTIASKSPAVNQGVNYSPYYAGFKRRTLAYFIDILITVFILFIASFIMVEYSYSIDVIILIGWIIPTWLYFAVFESSEKQATLGKMVGKIVVTDLEGKTISFWRATGRFLVKAFFTLLTLIGFGLIDVIFILFNKNKRSLHDILAGTLVTKKPPRY
ncbi:protein kinase domain-containing protein [Nodularia spumigena]|uniref:protein kinase domain-containing protein n=1 Tax=Nodularia spumigena TaxID=70799 RepID=UPI00232A9156|nr:RDD family protein [Nodularia spumigena]MDB9319047.1 RDD family protein [Nodularia spumigena CS-590/01A]MDB9328405.1 RDD family protein [Nodularia spumigena CS-590/02]MDB9334456.1 RDD family protein [Nodularia spumigena CS-590/01]